MARPRITVQITVNEKSHSVLIQYVDARGLVVADKRLNVKQGAGGPARTCQRLAVGVRQALEFAEAELDFGD